MAATAPEKLIPADAPQLSQRAIAQIINRVPVERIVEVIEGLLTAEFPNDKPDWKARESGAKLWLSYVIGLPVQRQEIVTHKVTSPRLPDLLKSPETRERLRLMLAEMDKGVEGDGVAPVSISE